ncbi:MAG: cytochrome C [Sulfurovum sp.]
MKKFLVVYVVLMSFAFAKGYTQADRISDMQKMAQAMQDIQSGFFYNNLDIIKAGADDLGQTIMKIGPTVEEQSNKDVYERWLDNNTAMTKRIERNVKQKSEEIVERFSDGDATQALQLYSKIMSECMKCHVRLRKW